MTFDRPVSTAPVGPVTFRVFAKSSGVPAGTFSFSNGDRTVTFTPLRPFSAGETVLVNLSHDLLAADASSLRAAGFAYQFPIRPAPATRAFTQIGTLAARSSPTVPTVLYGSFAADVDGDGWLDVATVNEDGEDVRVIPNLADGTGTLAGPLDVCVRRTGTTICWGARFPKPFQRQDARQLRAASE